ncbi:DUF2206 domain-containing protein [Methanospirillum lacunae]|nr:DUF2206 domain-containing protein [Methanospirillum lacunae]
MSQMTFLISSAQSRTVIAILFFGLSLMVLCSKEIEYSKIKLLIIIFSIIIIFSHYSTSYIHLVLYVGVALLSYFIKNNQKYHSPITIATILFLFTFMYFWFSIITKGAFNGAISVLNNVFIIDTFLSENTRAPELVQLLGKNLQDPIISGLNLIIQWLVLICIYTGILILFLFLIKKQIVPKFFFDRLPDFNYSAFYREFIILGFCCGIILAIVVILPNISKSFDIARTFTILSVITSCFFVIGAIFYSNLFREILIYNKILTPKYFVSVIIVFIVTLNFLFNAGIPHQLVGHRDTIIFNSEGEYYNQTIVHDQDHYGSIWLKSKMDNNNGITTDQMGKIILMSQALINQTTQFSELLVNSNQQNYIFFTHYMTNNKKFLNQWRESYQDIKTYDRIIEMNNKIYSTKSTEIWFKTM